MPGRYGHVLCHVLKVWDSCKLLPKHAVTGGQGDWQVKGNVRGGHEERLGAWGQMCRGSLLISWSTLAATQAETFSDTVAHSPPGPALAWISTGSSCLPSFLSQPPGFHL